MFKKLILSKRGIARLHFLFYSLGRIDKRFVMEAIQEMWATGPLFCKNTGHYHLLEGVGSL